MLNNYVLRLKSEFKGYNSQKLVKDILAGLTVAAVALPLALAFGVSSGADAGAGLITAIVAGLLIGGVYQVPLIRFQDRQGLCQPFLLAYLLLMVYRVYL